ncbi:hypothetical protein [Mesorhizobium sp. WSM4311]|nr:hypothetical protein [Mesorhizobium sp. WSM4311]
MTINDDPRGRGRQIDNWDSPLAFAGVGGFLTDSVALADLNHKRRI